MSHILLFLSDYMVLLNGDKHIYANYFYILTRTWTTSGRSKRRGFYHKIDFKEIIYQG